MRPEDFGLYTQPSAEFLEENCVWRVTLSDGTLIYQKDNAPVPELLAGIEYNHSAWVRLGEYMRQTDLDIVRWRLQFRDHVCPLKTALVGYVYSRGMIGSMRLNTDVPHRATQNFHLAGTIDTPLDRMVDRSWYHSPSLVHSETKTTALKKIDPHMIIWRKGVDKPRFDAII